MGREFVGVSESDTVADAAALLVDEGADFAVVVRGGRPVGRLTARDALSAFVGDGAATATDGDGEGGPTVGDVMADPAPTVDLRDGLGVAADRLLSESTSHLLVVDDDDLVGVLTERDVVAATASRGPDPTADVETLETNGGYDQTELSPNEDYSNQSICEVCGSLSRNLSNRNGQLVCSDCIDV